MGSRRLAALLVVCAGVLPGQYGTSRKASPGDYPVHASMEKLSIGAEYMVHSFSGGRQTFIAQDYLVVEVAMFPIRGARVVVNAGHFSLRVNGAKHVLEPQGPEFVAANLKYPDWETRPRMEASAGPVIFGRPTSVERFPGDPRPGQERLPNPPKAPPDDPSGQEREPSVSAEELVVQTALPEGEAAGPVSGYLYFPYKGKVTKIRSLELQYAAPAGRASLVLK